MAEYRITVTLPRIEDNGVEKENPANFSVTRTVACSARIGDVSCSILLKSLYFKKEVFHPGKVEAEMTVSVAQGSALPSFSTLTSKYNGGTLKVISTGDVIKDYTIYKVIPSYSSASSITSSVLRIEAYSPDYSLTFAKYSKCYTGKKLLTEVLAPELESFEIDSYLPTAVRDGSTNPEPDISNLRFLTYKDTSDKDIEFIQPYLVQYNESFYDFIVRVASRCGEFFYFEDGKLYLGLKKSDTETITVGSGSTVHEKAAKLTDCDEITLVQSADAGDAGVSVCHQREYFNKSDVVFTTDSRVNESELSQDDYMFALKKNEYDDFDSSLDALGALAGSWYMTIVSKLASSTDIYKFIVDSLIGIARLCAVAESIKNAQLKFFHAMYFPDDAVNVASDRRSGNSFSPFCSYNCAVKSEDVLRYKFYDTIIKGEQTVSRSRLKIRMKSDCYTPVFLGSVIKTDKTGDDRFIVVKVEVSVYDNLTVYPEQTVIIAGTTGKINKSERRESVHSYIVEAIPYNTYSDEDDDTMKPFPPLSGISPVRHSSPQAAVVVDGKDPKRLARVTIRYPWQQKKDAASPWIRVAVDRASKLGGTYYQADAGDEVLVDYVNGNVEKPFVVGQYYTAAVPPMFGTRNFSTVIASRNGHSIRMRDPNNAVSAVGGYIPAIRYIASWAPGQVFSKTDNENLLKMMGSISMGDSIGINSISMSTEGRSISIDSPLGRVSINAFTGISIEAPNGNVKISGKNVTIEAGNNLSIVSGSNVPLRADGYINPMGLGRTFASTIVSETLKLMDIELYRCIFDTFVRPIDGTLRINSKRFLVIEAGKGKAEVDGDAFREKKKDLDSGIFGYCKCISMISQYVDAFVSHYVTYNNKLYDDIVSFMEDYQQREGLSKNDADINTVKENLQKGTIQDTDIKGDDVINKLVVSTNAEAIKNYFNQEKPSVKKNTILDGWEEVFFENVRNVVLNSQEAFMMDIEQITERENKETFKKAALKLKREAAFKLITDALNNQTSPLEWGGGPGDGVPAAVPATEDSWRDFISKVRMRTKQMSAVDKAGFASFGSDIAEGFSNYFKTFATCKKWDAAAKGKILFSDESGRTIEYENGALKSRINRYTESNEISIFSKACLDLK